MMEKPMSPEERLVKWTEFAINNGVLEELHVQVLLLSFWVEMLFQGSRLNTIVYFNLDVFALLFAVIFTSFYVIYKIFSCLCSSRKAVSKRKNE